MLTPALIGITAVLTAYFVVRTVRHERESRDVRQASEAGGLVEPPSLHPVIDDAQCIGCGACVEACPERNVLGMVDGKADLVGPTHCIGHGACRAACPTQAIALVFGTARRGVDIPLVKPNFETNVGGIFIAGELGGMGLIRNAIEQGRQAIDSIRALDGIGKPERLDVVIVGAGPAGLSATLAARQHGLRAVTLEQDSLGGTVAHYPRGKIVMTAPAMLPIVGKLHFTTTTKEKLLEFLESAAARAGIEVRHGERVERIAPESNGFRVHTGRGEYVTRSVLLAIGRRGTPRKLGVPGEELSKVVYRLIDPEQYRGRRVLVVGGGDSAIEAATAVAEEAGTAVTLSYRGAAFSRAKEANRQRAAELERKRRLTVLLESQVRRIAEDHVELEQAGQARRLANDDVVVCAGGILPTKFLESLGVRVDTKFGTA
jgi:thioredoxin reductase/ferredoxin